MEEEEEVEKMIEKEERGGRKRRRRIEAATAATLNKVGLMNLRSQSSRLSACAESIRKFNRAEIMQERGHYFV